MRITTILSILIILISSCDTYGPNKKADFKKINDVLINNYLIDSVQLNDGKVFSVFVKSNTIENDFSFKRLESLIYKEVAEIYNPNNLYLAKKIELQIDDQESHHYKSSNTFEDVLKMKEYFDLSFNLLNNIFTDEEPFNDIVKEFKNSNCYTNIISDPQLNSANITGILYSKKGLQIKEVYATASGEHEYDFILILDANNEMIKYQCSE